MVGTPIPFRGKMLQMVEFLAFYILFPLIVSGLIIFVVLAIRNAHNKESKVRNLGGLIGGLLISVAVIILDLSIGGLIHLPSPNSIELWDIWKILISTVSIGFLFLLLSDFFLRRGAISFVIFFTSASSFISPYYLISLSQSRELTSLGVVGFATGWIAYFSIFLGRWLSFHTFDFAIESKDIETSLDPPEQKVNTGVNVKGNKQIGKNTIDVKGIGNVIGNDSEVSVNVLNDGKTDEVHIDIKRILDEIGRQLFKLSIGHPKLISKRFASTFLVQFYFEEVTASIKTKIKEIVGEDFAEHVYDTELKFGKVVKLKLFSPDLVFPEPIVKKLESSINSVTFLGKPLDTCEPGENKVVLSILDSTTDIEYQSETFSVMVVDFAFDHISRPLLSRVSAVVLGIGSLAMFILTFLEQIDKTVGLTSGTTTGVLALAIYAGFYNLYQRVRPNAP